MALILGKGKGGPGGPGGHGHGGPGGGGDKKPDAKTPLINKAADDGSKANGSRWGGKDKDGDKDGKENGDKAAGAGADGKKGVEMKASMQSCLF